MFHSPYLAIQHTDEAASVGTEVLITGCRSSDSCFSLQLSKLPQYLTAKQISQQLLNVYIQRDRIKSLEIEEKYVFFREFLESVSMCMFVIVSEL